MKDNPSILYLIPARGGSKGIPGKNIKHLVGKPLICHTIDQAREIAPDERICISTDSEKIKQVAEGYGLKVPFLRPEELSRDTSGSYEVMLHALDFYRSQGKVFDILVLLQPTSPFRTPEDIQKALDLYTPECDMVVTVTEASTNPYYNAFERDNKGYLHISKGDGLFTRRQDAPKVWEYNGAVYVINTKSLRQSSLGEFKYRIPCEMPPERSIDLDTPTDWLVAEILLSQKK